MENFENTNMGGTPVNDTQPADPVQPFVPPYSSQQQTWEQPAYGTAPGRKESPFANSPYVMGYNYQTYQAQPAEPRKKKSSGKAWKTVLAAVLIVAVVAAGCGITAFSVNSYWQDQMALMSQAMNEKIAVLEGQMGASGGGASVSGSPLDADGSLSPSQVYSMNKDAVVAVSSMISGYYGQGMAAGSGFILTEDGYVATNYHVIEGASEVSVILENGTTYDAEIVGFDSSNDLAVLKVDATGLPCVTLGSSDELIVGDQVVAVGNALGELSSSMTVGYISGKDRDVTTDGTAINMLQTDAAINSGNSGGPLFNMNGEVVGITTAKYSGTTSSGASIEGIGFAIPIDDVIGMIEDLTEYGYITGAYLGVTVIDMDATVSETYGLPMGAQVQTVTDGNCAQKAGVQAKDIIVNLGGYDVESVNDLTRALRKFKGGETTTITVFRGGSEMYLSITLDEKPHETAEAAPEATPEESQSDAESFYDWYSDYFPFFGGGMG